MPVHYTGSSKTPPCVLRKNVKEAEKNLKDIVEWTEREKMYAPSVVSRKNAFHTLTVTANCLPCRIYYP